MAERLVLHIGVQKSGTTYLQQLMQHRTRELADLGVQYQLPSGRRLKDGRINHHELATYGLLGNEYPWVNAERAKEERGWWEKLAAKVNEWPGTSVVSAEALSVIRADAASHVVEAFGCPANTDVLITARGLDKLLPSLWQQHIRNGRSAGIESFLGQLVHERESGWDVVETKRKAHMWRAFALGRLAQRWASVVGVGRVTVITNPGSPAELLWRRFLEASGIGSPSDLPEPEETSVHGGVTAAEAEVLNSININLSSAGWTPAAIKRFDNSLIHVFGEREQRGPRLALPAAIREQVQRWVGEDVADLHRSGVRIVGSTDELNYSPGSEPPKPTTDDVSDAAGVACRVAMDWQAEPSTSG